MNNQLKKKKKRIAGNNLRKVTDDLSFYFLTINKHVSKHKPNLDRIRYNQISYIFAKQGARWKGKHLSMTIFLYCSAILWNYYFSVF